jgi:hypothetical protein
VIEKHATLFKTQGLIRRNIERKDQPLHVHKISVLLFLPVNPKKWTCLATFEVVAYITVAFSLILTSAHENLSF